MSANPHTSVLGKGLIFPIIIDSNGKPSVGVGTTLIKSSLQTILSWPKNTRFFLPSFGSNLYALLEEPNDLVVDRLIQKFIQDAVAQWETRIQLLALKITRNSINPGNLVVTLKYRILENNIVDEFVYPFNQTF
jgi:hypothetical protein